MFSYFSSSGPNADEKNDEKCVFAAKSEIDNFPSKIIKPSEQTRYENLTQHESKICEYLATNYKSETCKFKFWTDDIIPRFVADTYYITDYKKRLDLTTTRFEQYLQQRFKFHFDDILTLDSLNTPKQQQIHKENLTILSTYYYGIDNEGHPCLWDNGLAYGQGDRIKHLFCEDNYERASYYLYRLKRKEKNLFLKLSSHFGVKISKSFYIFDLGKISASEFFANRAFYKWQVRTVSESFPETMHKVIVINVSWTFQMLWEIIRQFCDEITVQKTVILGSDYLNELTKYVDINMIPQEFGGKGIWGEPIPGDVPSDFPFQMDDIKKDMTVRKEYIYKHINYCNNKIICFGGSGDFIFELPADKDVLEKIKNAIQDGIEQKKEVIILVSGTKKNDQGTVFDAYIANDVEAK